MAKNFVAYLTYLRIIKRIVAKSDKSRYKISYMKIAIISIWYNSNKVKIQNVLITSLEIN